MEKYSKLSVGTQKKLASELKRIHKAGSTLAEAKGMTPQEYKTLVGSKAKLKSIEGSMRLLNQITSTKERREGTIEVALKSYEKFGFRGVGLEKIKTELTQVSGNTFSAISQALQDELGLSVKESYKRARELLALPESEYEKLDQQERDIIERYGFDTP